MGKEVGNGEESQDMWGSRRGSAIGALKRGFQDHLRYTQGRIPGHRHPERLLHGSRLYCERPVASSLDSKWRDIPERRPSGGSLSFRGISHGATACQQS